MVGRDTTRWRLIGALALAVGLLHGVMLAWLASQWQQPSVLRALATPLYTRTLTPSAPLAPQPRARSQAQASAPSAQLPSAQAPDDMPALAEPAPPQPLPRPESPIPDPLGAMAAASAPTPAAGASAASESEADTWPANTRLSYVLGGFFRSALHGDAQVQWTRDGERYQVQLQLSIGWLKYVTMTSQGQITPRHLRPQVFEEETGSNRRHVLFTAQELVFMNGVRQPLPADVQDTVSQFVELSHRFAQSSVALAVGDSVPIWLARPGGADEWTYDVVELETLALPRLGPVAAFHLVPRPLARPRGPITAEMWFAPTLQYLPARIKITLNEQTWVDLLVEKIEQSEVAAR